MHVTSNYYRSGEHLPVTENTLLERATRSVRHARESIQAEPLRPSKSTMRRLARHYKDSRSKACSA